MKRVKTCGVGELGEGGGVRCISYAKHPRNVTEEFAGGGKLIAPHPCPLAFRRGEGDGICWRNLHFEKLRVSIPEVFLREFS